MNFIRARIEDGSYRPHELIPRIQELSDQTGHSRHTISKALRILQDQGLVQRTPGLGYCATARAPLPADRATPVPLATGHNGSPADRPASVLVMNGHAGSPAGQGLKGATTDDH